MGCNADIGHGLLVLNKSMVKEVRSRGAIQVLVLDEADRLLDGKHGKDQMEALIRRLPTQRRTGASIPPQKIDLCHSRSHSGLARLPQVFPAMMAHFHRALHAAVLLWFFSEPALSCSAAFLSAVVGCGECSLRIVWQSHSDCKGLVCVLASGLFSATQTEDVKDLAKAKMRNPYRVNVAVEPVASTSGRAAEGTSAGRGLEQRVTPNGLQAFYMICQSDEKLAQLVHFLQVALSSAASNEILHSHSVRYFLPDVTMHMFPFTSLRP